MRSKSDEINVAQAQKFAGLLSDPLNPKIGLLFLAIVPPRSAGLPSWFGPRAGPGRWIRGPRVRRVIDRLVGSVLIGLGSEVTAETLSA